MLGGELVLDLAPSYCSCAYGSLLVVKVILPLTARSTKVVRNWLSITGNYNLFNYARRSVLIVLTMSTLYFSPT